MSRRRVFPPVTLLLAMLVACGKDPSAPPDPRFALSGCVSHRLIDSHSGRTVAGAEDLAVLDGSTLVISAHDRRAVARAWANAKSIPEGGLYVLKADQLAAMEPAAPIALTRLKTPVPLRPHGIAPAKAGGKPRLFVIDRRYREDVLHVRIWSFALAGPKLADARLLAEGESWCAANDLVFDPAGDRLLVTLDHAACTGWRRWWEDLWAAASGKVVALPLAARKRPSPSGKPLLAGLRWPNGLALTGTDDGARLWIAETRGQALVSLTLGKEDGGVHRIPLPAAPDNLTLLTSGDGENRDGGLLVAAHPSLFALALYRDHLFGRRRAPTMVLRLAPDGRVTTVYAQNGERLSAATTAVIWAGRLIATSAWDSRMLVCRLREGPGADERMEESE